MIVWSLYYISIYEIGHPSGHHDSFQWSKQCVDVKIIQRKNYNTIYYKITKIYKFQFLYKPYFH